ncbi:methylcrotonoyl-CoA carboxylase subunit alpha, mitochondrial [Hetaerina americana]|uniref:methylcrotonoyl-CoA carboxylase subunit alpha, mitochondrial n=2 Tax=Hetaerina americana TaxID=62018 RepID=UPI003A7F6139
MALLLRNSILRRWWCIHNSAFSVRFSSHDVKPINKVLIANRGEIACRVMKTAKKLGIKTVAVFSDADIDSMHVAMADESYRIGPAPSRDSYLKQDKVIQVALKSGAEAIHPGYGFLSENMEFARLCQQSGIIFIGPPAAAIESMGIKSTSKAIMSDAGVPVIQGYHGEDQSLEKLKGEADRIGYPVMIKAIRGGGGKGMRIVMKPDEFESQLDSAKREAIKSFGDDAMLIEKYIERPRHVEVQIFGDTHGNYVYLFERDCSVQRRHQKIIEEAPAPGIPEETRKAIGEAGVRAARAVGYVGAGTVEFIMDVNHNFFFMEMNTRLQVEHPVSEMITGTDLVEWQLKVASGEKLPKSQEELRINGHSFESRIYAEDPAGGFLPGAGQLHYLSTPDPGPDVRIETGVRQGDEVSVHYDPMIAKLVVWGENRYSALQKMKSHLSSYNIVGLNTNVDFLMDLCSHPSFIQGNVHTDFIEEHYKELFPQKGITSALISQVAIGCILNDINQAKKAAVLSMDPFSPLFTVRGIRVNHHLRQDLSFIHNEKDLVVTVTHQSGNHYGITYQDETQKVTVMDSQENLDGSISLVCNIGGGIHKSKIVISDADVAIFTRDSSHKLSLKSPSFLAELSGDSSGISSGSAVAPMPGVVEKVLVSDGDVVKAGDPLLIMIAMKMEHVIRAHADGNVKKVLYKVGDNVKKNAVLVQFQEES